MQVFFSSRYTFELPADHPFPIYKYQQCADYLVQQGLIGKEQLLDPGLASVEDLLLVHSAGYVEKIMTGRLSADEIRKIGFPWSEKLVERSLAAAAGSIEAAKAALKTGGAANLAGGTHHAFADHGSGYCLFNDVAIAIRCLHRSNPQLKVQIVDLDAHQGNGTSAIFASDERVYTLSMHVGSNYPRNKFPSSLDIALERNCSGQDYLAKLKDGLEKSLWSFEPDLLVYLAGADVHKDDRFGQMNLSTEEMLARDKLVLETAKGRALPFAIVLGGGYNKDKSLTARLHAQTIATALSI
ncbi:MAG: histone deacetylase [Candidatus Melainabacteria bacterium]|nr:histone deacetylase [Candidatus Melainabacteria bacterium]